MTSVNLASYGGVAERSGERVKFAAISAIFFLSGFAALIYQTTWQRALFSIFGINVEATTVVVSGFLLGLGFGSLFGGRLSRVRTVSLLVVFGLIELSIGAFGLISLPVFHWVGARTLAAPTVVTAAVTIGLLLLPTLLMGATLPVLGQYLVERARNVGRSIGLLYCVNTLGSAAGCLVAAVWLMREMGMQGSVNVAAAINIFVGLCALYQAFANRGAEEDQRVRAAEAAPMLAIDNGVRTSFAVVLVLSAVTGYVSLSYEIVWFRAFMIVTNIAPAFAVVLGAYLAGLGLGSYAARRYCESSTPSPTLLSLLSVTILASSILGIAVLPLAARTATWGSEAFVPLAMIVLIFAQTTIAGAIFPVMCHLGIAPDARAGERLSRVYVANILGSVAGTLVTGFVLMDFMSTPTISVFLGVLGVLCALAVAWIAPMPRMRRVGIASWAFGILLLSPTAVNALFSDYYERITYRSKYATSTKFVDVVENKSGVITVNEEQWVYGGGMYDGVVSVDLVHDVNMLARPASLSLFHAAPREVLMVGLGTGAWAQLIVNHPGVEKLTIVEINPGYLGLIEKYPAVSSVLRSPKVEVFVDDGRRWLNRNPGRKFDAIVQNTTFNFRPNVTNVLSQEYLRLSSHHLKQGGLVMYNTTLSNRAQRTGCLVFPHGMRVLNAMVVGNQPMPLDPARMRATLEAYRIDGKLLFDPLIAHHRERLDEIMQTVDPASGQRYEGMASAETCPDVLTRTRALTPITDDNMGEEWQVYSVLRLKGGADGSGKSLFQRAWERVFLGEK